MLKKFDITGKVFGRLTVLKRVGSKNGSRNVLWECLCSCGKFTKVTGSRLRSLHTKSCGCLVPSRLRIRNEGWEIGARNLLYAQYRSKAKSRNIEFDLDKDYFDSMTQMNCFYCNSKLSSSIKYGSVHRYSYNGLDRVDSSKGYIKGNVVPCCSICNTMKFDLKQDEFYNHIKTIVLNRGL